MNVIKYGNNLETCFDVTYTTRMQTLFPFSWNV